MNFTLKIFGCQINFINFNKINYYLKFFKKTNNINFDILFINTCSVREKCHKKFFLLIKKLFKFKFLIILNGCFSNLYFLFIIKYNYINIVLNNNFFYLKFLINNVYYYNCKQLIFNFKNNKNYYFKSNLTNIIISDGCNRYCSYCIIPFSRGREINENFWLILKKLINLNLNFKEIFLLGQNVNSYNFNFKDKIFNFYNIFRFLKQFLKILKILYLTINFKNMDWNINFYKDYSTIHIPLQSASNKILKFMNRKYKFFNFKIFIYKLKKFNISVTTDIIICFPKEKNKDFNKTYICIEKLFFDKSYIFIYNLRSYTSSIYLFNNINDNLKKSRFIKIFDKIKNNSYYINNYFIFKSFKFLLKNISLQNNYLYFSFFNNRIYIYFNNFKKCEQNAILNIYIKNKIYNLYTSSNAFI